MKHDSASVLAKTKHSAQGRIGEASLRNEIRLRRMKSAGGQMKSKQVWMKCRFQVRDIEFIRNIKGLTDENRPSLFCMGEINHS